MNLPVSDIENAPPRPPEGTRWIRLLVNRDQTVEDQKAIELFSKLPKLQEQSENPQPTEFTILSVSDHRSIYDIELPSVIDGELPSWQGFDHVRRFCSLRTWRYTTPLVE